MAGAIQWFRWYHGCVTDPKFQVVAKKANVRPSDVIAVWAFILEKASAAEFRSEIGDIDCESVDCLYGLDEGSTDAILCALEERGLIAEGFIVAWEKRQPSRERPSDNSTQRVKAHRDKKRHVTPCNASNGQETPRVEKSREEKNREEENAQPRKTNKGSRLPEDWLLPDEWKVEAEQIVKAEGFSLTIEREALKFRDFWIAKSGKDAVKADWRATWRGWIRRAGEYGGRSNAVQAPIAKTKSLDEVGL